MGRKEREEGYCLRRRKEKVAGVEIRERMREEEVGSWLED